MLPDVTTIAAVASPTGTGALSLIRISGPFSLPIAGQASKSDLNSQASHTIRHRKIHDAQGQIIDDGLISVFRAPSSATGEDCVEFTGHGGILVTQRVLSRFLECGARLAEPGEFTKRAFLNGKLDLTQAEAIVDLISAQTDLSLRAARGHLGGHLSRRTSELRDSLLRVLAHLEAWIDFPDEDISPDSAASICEKTRTILKAVQSLLETADQGRVLRDGVLTVIHGAPNVGKSSLLNHLLGYERAIVCETAGTTRDTIEETINFHGIPIRLVDTAGIRDTTDAIELQGISRAMEQVESADLVLHLMDGSKPRPERSTLQDTSLPRGIEILNKSDLQEDPSWTNHRAVRISCRTGEGMDSLRKAITEILHLDPSRIATEAIAINSRHQKSLQLASLALESAIRYLDPEIWNAELASIDLREGLDALGEIPGKLDSEDLLGEIFSQFCIGK